MSAARGRLERDPGGPRALAIPSHSEPGVEEDLPGAPRP